MKDYWKENYESNNQKPIILFDEFERDGSGHICHSEEDLKDKGYQTRICSSLCKENISKLGNDKQIEKFYKNNKRKNHIK
jgi:hypothetical protein